MTRKSGGDSFDFGQHDRPPPDHPHLATGRFHAHAFVIGDTHCHWP